jgi:poly-gamma-glutamate synthesis protein (capsule biosynthesis protein)
LEGPVLDKEMRPLVKKRYLFANSVNFLRVLGQSGVNVVNLANNHAGDFGMEGIANTLQLTRRFGIVTVGAGMNHEEATRPAIFRLSSRRIAFAGICLMSNVGERLLWLGTGHRHGGIATQDDLPTILRRARKGADYVVLALHGGDEFRFTPSTSQVRFARKAIRLGANLVVGHHPHVVQGGMRWRSGTCFFSVGDFVLGNTPNQAIAIRVDFTNDIPKPIEVLPLSISESTPAVLDSDHGSNLLKRFQRSSKRFGLNVVIKGSKAYASTQLSNAS